MVIDEELSERDGFLFSKSKRELKYIVFGI